MVENRESNRRSNMKKLWMIGAGVIALSISGVKAEDQAKPEAPVVTEEKVRHAKPELKELTIEGVLQKSEHKKKDGTLSPLITLVTDDGAQVWLPKNGPEANLESLIGSRVKVVGTGYEMDRGGKKRIGLKSIKSVEKVVVPAK
jgi:hypothetical protein